MNQVKYNKYKNSTIKVQSASNEKNKHDLRSSSKDKQFYQYNMDNPKNRQYMSNEEKTMSSEDLNDKIKEIITKHGGYIPSEQNPINEERQDEEVKREQFPRAKCSEFKQNEKKKQIETKLKKLSSSGSSSIDRFNKQYSKKTDDKPNVISKNNNLSSNANNTSYRPNSTNQNYIYEQDQSSSLEANCDATNYSFSEGISSGDYIQESKGGEEMCQQISSQASQRNKKVEGSISKTSLNVRTEWPSNSQKNICDENNEMNESFGNQEQYKKGTINKTGINTDRNSLFLKKQDGNQPKFSTPVKHSVSQEYNNGSDIKNGSGLKPANCNSSSSNFINNSIVNSINENSIKKAQPNSKLSLENSIKNIKIKNLTVKNLEEKKINSKKFKCIHILQYDQTNYFVNQKRIKLIVKPPLLVSEICRGIVGLFCLTGEINENETFLSRMNNDWTDIQPLFSSPGQMINLICRAKSLIKAGKINERNIRYVSKTLDSIEQLVKMEEDSRELDEMQTNHFEYQVIMENMVVFVDFLGATCDYFFRTSQSNLPISMDTYLSTSKCKKESSLKYPNQQIELKESQPQSIQISSYLEEYRDNQKSNNLQNTQSSLFPNMSYALSNKSEQYPKIESSSSQIIPNNNNNNNNNSKKQNDPNQIPSSSSPSNKSPTSNTQRKKYINTTPQERSNQKYFLSNSRSEYSRSDFEESKQIPSSQLSSQPASNSKKDFKQMNNNNNNPKANSYNQYPKGKQNLSLNRTSDTYHALGSPSTQKLNSTFMTNATQSRSQTPTNELLNSQQKNLNRSQSKLKGVNSNRSQLNTSHSITNKPQAKLSHSKNVRSNENQEQNSSMNLNRSVSRNKIGSAKPLKESTNQKNGESFIPPEQDFRKNRLEKIMELKVKKPKVESLIKRMINGDPIYQDVLLKRQRPSSKSSSRNNNNQQQENSGIQNSHILSGSHRMCDPYEHQKSHLSENLNKVQSQVIQLSQKANKVEWDEKRNAKESIINEENEYQKYDLNFKKEEHSRLKDFQKSVYEDEKQLLKDQSESTFLMNRSRREYEKSIQIQNNADEEFRYYIEMKYKQAMGRRQMMQQKNELETKKQEYEDVRNYKSHQKSFDIIDQKSRYGDEEVSRLNYSIQKSVERKNELEKRLEKTLDVIYNFRKITSFKNMNDSK